MNILAQKKKKCTLKEPLERRLEQGGQIVQQKGSSIL